MCKEIPYEELNALQVRATQSALSASASRISQLKQNDGVAPGSNYYMKSIFVSGPQPDVAEDILSHLDTLTEKHKLRMLFIYEFFPIKKVLSVPTEATAYVRRPRLSTMVLVRWDNDGSDKLADVRLAATELTNLALSAENKVPPAENTGYGNYSTCFPRRFYHRSLSSVCGFTVSEEIVPVSKDVAPTSRAEALFGENYPRLQKIKNKYDPEGIFSRWYGIKPNAS